MTRSRRLRRGQSLQRGFTYIWLLLTIALMGVSLVMAAEVQTTASQRDRETELLAIGQQFRYALASYYQARLPNNPVGAGGTAAPAAIPFGQAVSGAPPAAGGGAAAPAMPGGVLAANPAAVAAAVANAASSGLGTGSGLPPQVDPLGYPATLDELLKDNRFPG
ncbi:MAG: type II secretion system protein, partial [Haliea sp.]